jgi:rhodanese-related sulfurtransferase
MIRQTLRFAALAACTILAACSSPQAEAPAAEGASQAQVAAPEIAELDVDSLQQSLNAGEDIFLLDVRRPDELQENGLIEGSVNIPIDELEARLSEVPTDKPIAIYCQAGGRASRAAELLRAKGYDAPIACGGISAWKARGHAVVYPAKSGE